MNGPSYPRTRHPRVIPHREHEHQLNKNTARTWRVPDTTSGEFCEYPQDLGAGRRLVCPVYNRESYWVGVAYTPTPKPIVDRFIPTAAEQKIHDQLHAEWLQLLEEEVTISNRS
jgi:hypothetical protein